MNPQPRIKIFTDGSSRGNPGPGGWGAIICSEHEVKELGGGEDYTTNNKMELSAAINAITYVAENSLKGDIIVETDSKYLIQGITEWIIGWQKNGWKTSARKNVENRELWEALYLVSSDLPIQWKHVESHAGHPGNERCDEIATTFADKAKINLYHGQRLKYPIKLI